MHVYHFDQLLGNFRSKGYCVEIKISYDIWTKTGMFRKQKNLYLQNEIAIVESTRQLQTNSPLQIVNLQFPSKLSCLFIIYAQ